MSLTARGITALVMAMAMASAGHAQSPDAFRITRGSDRPQNVTLVAPTYDAQLERALASGQVFTDLSLTADVSYRQLNRAEYAVPVSIRIAPASELVVGRGVRSRLDFVASVTDAMGYTVGNLRDAAELTLDATSIAALATTPIVYDTSFVLLPGRYTLKLLARDQTTGRIGSTIASFTIPNLARQQAQ
jgi:hypothetical protein